MRPQQSLPIDASWESTEQYVDSILTFVTTSTLFRNLCGGVHILDFLTRKPDLYCWVLPQEWRDWFEEVEVEEVLDLLLREDLSKFSLPENVVGEKFAHEARSGKEDIDSVGKARWRGHSHPPASLVKYADTIRRHSLRREYKPRASANPLPRHIAVGMKPKKIHEVAEFAAFVDEISDTLATRATASHSREERSNPTVIDFGSGQNYLGRTLACPPHNKHVVAIEQRHHNVEGARGMDVHAKLAKKEKRIINKKKYKQSLLLKETDMYANGSQTLENEVEGDRANLPVPGETLNVAGPTNGPRANESEAETPVIESDGKQLHIPVSNSTTLDSISSRSGTHTQYDPTKGSIQYIEKELSSGDLTNILHPPPSDSSPAPETPPPSVVVSIHSCGNLTHHGLRSLTLNPSVHAVAMVGCCYNLLTERLGPATYKLPSLRSNHPRLEATSSSFDPHGFPMSKRFEDFEFLVEAGKPTCDASTVGIEATTIEPVKEKGVRLNITARMMAVQAPHNWGPKDSEEFFTKHYYRALLQRILLDLGVVQMATASSTPDIEVAGGTLSGKDSAGSPLIIGSLRKSCFSSFPMYVRGAIEKLSADPVDGTRIQEKTRCLVEDEGMITRYEEQYAYAKKHLSVIWSLMAFSANVIESTILVDRWLWLKEQEVVEDAWVQSVFDYRLSPRNMVVVGIKKRTIVMPTVLY
ncbi:hypothetical protein H2198_001850 [Neophaeococcomyces mojaviensis]|uniref:Uncharacterized protein n=1 Tax=Neophaeococcomyces mojaviensis TaxID=3383035 RepID=A0ACC3AG74_9EURO|nr:hypothetical protein H2198_001850 [Knufia sp. JES_112]